MICVTQTQDGLLRACAKIAWAEATESQKAIIKFGMVPVELLDHFDLGPVDPFTPREIALALFDEANAHGGMVV